MARDLDPLYVFATSEYLAFNDAIDSLHLQVFFAGVLRWFLLYFDLFLFIFCFVFNYGLVNPTTYLLAYILTSQLRSLLEPQTVESHPHLVVAVLAYLEQGIMPEIFQSSTLLSTDQRIEHSLTFENVVTQLRERKSVLVKWLQNGRPGQLKLHQLSNPAGLLHALKESFSFSSGIAVNDLEFQASLTVTQKMSEQDESIILDKISTENFGAGLLLSGIELHNSFWSEENYGLELFPHNSTSTVAQQVYVQLVVQRKSLDDRSDYSCPLCVRQDKLVVFSTTAAIHSVVACDGQKSSAIDGLCTGAGAGTVLVEETSPLVYLVLPCLVDPNMCASNNVCLLSEEKTRVLL